MASFCTIAPRLCVGWASPPDIFPGGQLALSRMIGPACPSAPAGELASFCTFALLRRLGVPARHLPGDQLASFCTFRPPGPWPTARLGSFRTVRLTLETSNLKLLLKLGSFCIFCAAGLPVPTARARSRALGQDWVRFAHLTAANWVCFA